jgi:hypothetical protein
MKGRIIILLGALCAAIVASVSPAKAQFSGCGAGAFGSGTIGMLSAGGPVGISSSGYSLGVTGECGWKFGAMYLGAGVDWSNQYGDLNTVGLRSDLTVFGKAGVVVSNTAMIYAHAGRAWLTTTGPDVNAWKIGAGTEIKLANTPLYLDFRYTYTMADEKDLGLPAGIDVTGHSVRAGLNVKFGPGMYGSKGALFSNEDYASQGCDPKIDRNCKRG